MTASSKAQEKKEKTYSEASGRLEEILKLIEEQKVDVDQLSTLVREAATLIALCRAKIKAAEAEIEVIAEGLAKEGSESLGEAAREAAEDAVAASDEPAGNKGHEGEEVPF